MLEISVCVGSACHMKGSYNVIQAFQQAIEADGLHDKIMLKAMFCMKQCHKNGVSLRVGEEYYSIPAETAGAFFKMEILPKILD